MGGPARATKTELDAINRTIQQGLDAYRALGQQAPKELQKVADAVTKQRKELAGGGQQGGGLLGGANNLLGGLGIGALSVAGITTALVAGGKAALDYADTLTKLSDKTGIAVVPLQRLAAVAAASGNDVEQIASGVNQFQKRVTEGADGTVDAIKRIGLTVEKLRSLSPDEQFFAIAKGIQSIKDPAEQTRTAMDLFGKSGAELLPTLKSDVDKLKDSTFKMSETSVKALDDFGDRMTSVGTSAINVLGEIAGAAITAASKVLELGGVLPKEAPAPGQQGSVGSPIPGSGLISITAAKTQLAALSSEVLKFKTATGFATVSTNSGFVQGLRQGADAVDDIHAAFKAFADQSAERAVEAVKKFNENLSDVLQRARGFETVLDTINGSVIEAVRDYRDQGVELSKLAQVYDLTETQVWALGEAEKAEQATLSALTRGNAELTKALKDRKRESREVLDAPSRSVPNVGVLQGGPNPELERIRRGTGDATEAVQGLSNAFALMAQIGGDSFGGISRSVGSLISQINLAQQAAKAFGVDLSSINSTVTLGIASGGLAVISALAQAQAKEDQLNTARIKFIGEAFSQYAASASNLLGNKLAQPYIDALLAAKDLTEAQKRLNDLMAAMAQRRALLDEANSQFGPSQSELDRRAQHAKELLDLVTSEGARGKDGSFTPDFTPEQQAKAYRAWQQAMADAGNAAAKAWIAAQGAADGATTSGNAAIDALMKRREELSQSVANEAPEEVMGVIESQIRGQIAALDNQIAAQQAGVDATTEQATDAAAIIQDKFGGCFGRVSQDGKTAADEILDHFNSIEPVITVRYKYVDGDSSVQGAATGGFVTPTGIQHFAGGGVVLPFRRRGTDTVPAMLTPGEMVLNAAQQGRLAGAISGAQVGAINVSVYPAQGEDERALGDRIVRALRTNSDLYDAVGVVAQRRVG